MQSMSSEQFSHQSSFTIQHQTSFTHKTNTTATGFKAANGPWGAGEASQTKPQDEKEKPKSKVEYSAPKTLFEKQKRDVESESSDDYGEEIKQPKTRKQKGKPSDSSSEDEQPQSKPIKKSESKPEEPKVQENLIDLFGSAPQQTAQPQTFAFNFMNTSTPVQQVQ